MSQGKFHEYEPDADSLSYIDFDEGSLWEMSDRERIAWHLNRASEVAAECGLPWYGSGEGNDYLPGLAVPFLRKLETDGESLAWSWLGGVVTAAGFDVYDSDSRFEVFEGGTPESYPAESGY